MTARASWNFSTAADEELCRLACQRSTQRLTTALVAIIALHRSRRSRDQSHCLLCRETWPCQTVSLAASRYQRTEETA